MHGSISLPYYFSIAGVTKKEVEAPCFIAGWIEFSKSNTID
jgi:hypothetical protein